MRSIIILSLIIGGWANALTLSPMKIDELTYSNFYLSKYTLRNTYDTVMYYDVSVYKDKLDSRIIYSNEEVLGSNDYKTIEVPILNIDKDNLEKYYICVTEIPEEKEMNIAGRVCSRLRLYYPYAQLHQ